ncbi:TonB-dependent receptor [Parvularcula flava]|uniref:TonB-dependent receptor n=1 Tax=Aquisalinus luteolus TaxID=1566827 RepID=A0A8J3EUY0_9PROT|nr:TonB-dependent receptor [Aquisalinus luteolus]NHK28495.1 TonB-dependent receptor [Aquisalinus luteolus]GGH98649.1 TonB-dependent receptor [Aquisalinus luteolus]
MKNRNALLMGSSILVATAMAAAPAFAQVDEIVITTQKKESTLLDTPVAVTAVSAEQMEKAQITNIQDLQTLTPSLSVYQQSGAGVVGYAIRGIGTSSDNIGLEPSVGVFVDGVYKSRQSASINDFISLERVEVIRGPQSTLYGRNTPAGVISYTTRLPTNELEAIGEATIGNYNSRILKGTVSGPISDTVGFRVSGVVNKRDGYIDNIEKGEDVNNRDRFNLRGQLYFEPTDKFSFRLIGEHGQIDEDCCAAPFSYNLPANAAAVAFLGGTVLDDEEEREVAFDGDVNTTLETSALSGTAEYQFDNGITLTSITAWDSLEEDRRIDPDFTNLRTSRPRQNINEYDVFSQEIRFDGEFDRARWLAGFYYYTQDLSTSQSQTYGEDLRPFADLITANAQLPGGSAISYVELFNMQAPGTYLAADDGLILENYDVETDSYSLFGQIEYDVTDRLTLTGGLRVGSEEKSSTGNINVNDPFSALTVDDFAAAGNPLIYQQAFATAFFNNTGLQPTPQNIQFVATNNAPAFAAIQAGAQAFADANDSDPSVNPLLGLTALQFNTPGTATPQEVSDDFVSGTLIADYALTDNLNVYGSYARGFKAGGINVSFVAYADNATSSPTFDPEITTSYELGVKSRLFDNRMTLNAALFDQKVEDYQDNTFNGRAFVLQNAGEVGIQGLELESVIAPTPNLTINAGWTHLFKAEYEEYLRGSCPAVAAPEVVDFLQGRPDNSETGLSALDNCIVNGFQDSSGLPLSGAREDVASLFATYEGEVANYPWFIRGGAYHSGEVQLGTDQDPRKIEDAVTLFNGSIGFSTPDERVEVMLWGRNLTDEYYNQGVFTSVGAPGSLNAYPGDPRTYGITVRLKN